MTTESKRLAIVVAAMAALTRPASAQAPGQAGPAPAPAPRAQQATPDAQNIINQLHARNVQLEEYGKLAQERGSSPRVKSLGQKFQSDAQRLDSQLSSIAQGHGVKLADSKTITQDLALKQGLDSLRKPTGADFDRAFAEATATAREQEVDQLKAMRDRTPGSDPQLKKYLDDYENVLEESRNMARDVRSETQRQGRTPPK